MRQRFIQDRETGELMPAESYVPQPVAPMVMNDIRPYKSMLDGSIVTSRSIHRRQLREHGCVEVGNETAYLKPFGNYSNPPGLKRLLIDLVNERLR